MGPGTALVDGPRRPPRRSGGADHGPWPGIAPSADGALGRWGVSRRARRGYFARCGGRPEALPLDSAIWATRCRLARGVGEEFCVRARRSFAAILDVWQEAGPQLWRKRPGDTRRHTGGKLPHRKNRVKLLFFYKNRVQGSTDGGGAVTVMGVPVTGWKNETLWDQRHMGNSSGSDQYFRSPANGIPRPENCARI